MKKYLLILAIGLPVFGFAQDIHKCDSGYSWMPSLSTSSLRIDANQCLPDSLCKKLWHSFRENMCGEMGMFMGGGDLEYYHKSTWDKKGDSCITGDFYSKRAWWWDENKNWHTEMQEISQQEYRNLCRCEFISSSTDTAFAMHPAWDTLSAVIKPPYLKNWK